MNTCVNCDSPAEFVLTTPAPANYCEKHLPGFARKTNQFVSFEPVPDVVPATVEVPVEAPTPKAPKKKTTSEAPAEETTAPAEEPTP